MSQLPEGVPSLFEWVEANIRRYFSYASFLNLTTVPRERSDRERPPTCSRLRRLRSDFYTDYQIERAYRARPLVFK